MGLNRDIRESHVMPSHLEYRLRLAIINTSNMSRISSP
jgi:hypothetical protein